MKKLVQKFYWTAAGDETPNTTEVGKHFDKIEYDVSTPGTWVYCYNNGVLEVLVNIKYVESIYFVDV